MRTLLHTVWLLALLIGLFCAGLFLQGVVRDKRIGDPDVGLDLSRGSSAARRFLPWRGGWHDLAVSSVNHAPPFGPVFQGRVEITLIDGSGDSLINRYFDGSSVHARPSNMSWTPLDSVSVGRSFFRRMTLSARVIEPDPQFAGVRTNVHLRRRQYDPGMGGMLNYVMLVPGILFLVIALGLGANMSGRGWGKGPFRVTIALTVFMAAIALLLRGA